MTAEAVDRYRPRDMAFAGLWSMPRSTLKLYTITATPEPIDPEATAMARRVVEAEGVSRGPGFVILHRGEEALWLLLHWWLPGGILAEQLWSSALDGSLRFEARDRPLMACVWELVPIAYERDCYVKSVMRDGGVDDYLLQTLPDGCY